MTEQDALTAVESARAALAQALEALREVRGEPADEECRHCRGSGKDALAALRDSDEPCDFCSGDGRKKKSYPLIVNRIEWGPMSGLEPSLFHGDVTWVKVRPCAKEFGGKTYLGWLLGDIALGAAASMHKDGTLRVNTSGHNPAMLVPDLKRVIYGRESWWSPLGSADDLKQISDADIQNVWYVKALQDLTEDPCTP